MFAQLPRQRPGVSALYNHVTVPDIGEILDQHVRRGRLVRRLIEATKEPATKSVRVDQRDPTGESE